MTLWNVHQDDFAKCNQLVLVLIPNLEASDVKRGDSPMRELIPSFHQEDESSAAHESHEIS
jgi:hypothetical protein